MKMRGGLMSKTFKILTWIPATLTKINESVVLPPNELIDQFIHIRKEMIKEFEDIKKIITKEIPK